jgi:hypothetical protein
MGHLNRTYSLAQMLSLALDEHFVMEQQARIKPILYQFHGQAAYGAKCILTPELKRHADRRP